MLKSPHRKSTKFLKSSKTEPLDFSRPLKRDAVPSRNVPDTIQEFITFANAVPPNRRPEFMLGERNGPTSHGKLFMIHVFDWLYETPWSVHLPKRIEVRRAL